MNEQIDGDKAGKREDFATEIVMLYVLGFVLFIIGPLVTLLIGAVKGRRQIRYRILMGVSIWFLAIHCTLLFAYFIPNYRAAKLKGQIGQLKSNAHTIQIALESYWLEYCYYPDDPRILEETGYLPPSHLYNPFTSTLMKLTPFDYDNKYASIGYVPVIYKDKAIRYYLVTFGTQNTQGVDFDGYGASKQVVMVLQDGCDCIIEYCNDFYTFRNEAGPPPPLEEAVKELKWVWK